MALPHGAGGGLSVAYAVTSTFEHLLFFDKVTAIDHSLYAKRPVARDQIGMATLPTGQEQSRRCGVGSRPDLQSSV